jgi:drug/metabolite transporter (DMT)-like permease
MVAIFGVIGYVFIKLGCEPAPLLLGFILGPMMEENLRRALLLSRGDWSVLVTRPLSAGLLAAAGCCWWSSWRCHRSRPSARKPSSSDWAGVLGLGFAGYYLSSFLDFVGLQYVTASLERLIMYLTPTLVLLLGWLVDRRPVRRAQLAGMAVSYSGVLLVFGREIGTFGPRVAWGTTLIFTSTVTYALYLVYSGKLVQRLGSLRLVGLATTVACVCCIAQFALLRPLGSAFDVAPAVLWLSVLNATLCTAVPVLLVMMAIERIGPALSAQTGMVGPLSTIAMGVVILGEPFTGWIVAGTVLVVAGIWVFTRGGRHAS